MKAFSMNRRSFLKRSSLASLSATTLGALHVAPSKAAAQASQRVRVGVMGLGRGMAHVRAALALPHVELAYVCDVDQQRTSQAIEAAAKSQPQKPKGVADFRRMLDDKELDAVMIAHLILRPLYCYV